MSENEEKEKKVDEQIKKIYEAQKALSKLSRSFQFRTISDSEDSGKIMTPKEITKLLQSKIKQDSNKMSKEVLENKLTAICNEMEQTDIKVAKLKKKLLTEI